MKPYWILRHHGSSSIRSLHFAHNLLAVGDDAGHVSLVDLQTLRPKHRWSAHSDSVLTVLVVAPDQVISHARDNSLKLWRLASSPPQLGAGATSETPTPEEVRSIGVNALNFSKCAYHDGTVAVPNALDAAYIDILDLHTGKRIHEAIGRPDIPPSSRNRLPIVMSLHLLPNAVIAGYEDGQVKSWSRSPESDLLWQTKCHSESVMSIAIHPRSNIGISVAADDRIARFDLDSGTPHLTQTQNPGKASTAIAPDAATSAVGGWDGSIRIYSTKDMAELGMLSYHRDTVECLAFAHVRPPSEDDNTDDDDDDRDDDDNAQTNATPRELILAAGGKDGKISLWKYH